MRQLLGQALLQPRGDRLGAHQHLASRETVTASLSDTVAAAAWKRNEGRQDQCLSQVIRPSDGETGREPRLCSLRLFSRSPCGPQTQSRSPQWRGTPAWPVPSSLQLPRLLRVEGALFQVTGAPPLWTQGWGQDGNPVVQATTQLQLAETVGVGWEIQGPGGCADRGRQKQARSQRVCRANLPLPCSPVPPLESRHSRPFPFLGPLLSPPPTSIPRVQRLFPRKKGSLSKLLEEEQPKPE